MYLKATDLKDMYRISISMVNKIVREMLDCKRYPKSAIIGDRRFRRIDSDAFQDYMENMEYLRHPTMKKYVQPYKTKKGA